ncbi:possible sensor protein [unidentified eubacterium SCB49]|nr:possible sensor protein [unidentified eubacterium SCB49]
MKTIKTLFLLFSLLIGGVTFSQNDRSVERPMLTIEGEVLEDKTDKPISKVNIEILGGAYTTTNPEGRFKIKGSVGQELIIRSANFETVYHLIKNDDFIKIKVLKTGEAYPPVSKFNPRSINDFSTYIDSARVFVKTDATKSINYITEAINSVPGGPPSPLQNKIAFELLGDINSYWSQPDLAADNYKRSISASSSISVKIKLAKAYVNSNNYQESIALCISLQDEKLTPFQEVEVYEILGDTYKAIDDTENGLANYQKALDKATKHIITPKITDLNSKLADLYASSGAADAAAEYYGNSLELSKRENKKRAAIEKDKVADFYGKNQDFDKEIELRNMALEEIESLEDEEEQENGIGALSPQRQNYKIGNAYLSQEKYDDAIPFYEKSIEEADAKEDLVVKKDATRKLSELYRDRGDFDKAAESYEKYVAVVDELYIKKEQEISQAARFSKEMVLKQNRITSLENDRKLNESRYKLAFENEALINKNNSIQKWIIGSLIVIALLLLYAAYSQYRNVKQQRYVNNQLALKNLRSQMNPHFIFNALNSVNSFISSNDERAANRYLSDFSQLMRSVLENSEENFIPLSKEIELLRLYVKLEHFRFKDKFDYRVVVDPEIDLEQFVIPPMLLQPYIENAVWHGLRYKKERGNLDVIFAKIDEETVAITIVDDGIGRTKSKALKTENQKKQQSKGMGNIKKRISILNKMYRDKVDVLIEDAQEDATGTKVQLTLKKD